MFGLTGQRGPTAQELKALQDSCEGEMNMMRHCRQCRADAVGLLGEDRSAEFTTDKIMAMEVNYDLDTRKAYQAKVEEERVRPRSRPSRRSLRRWPASASDIKLLVAVATKGGGPHQRALRPRQGVPGLRALARRARNSSAIAASISIARAASATRTASRRSSAPSTIATPCSSPRSAAARRTICSRRASSRSTSLRMSSSRNRRSPGSRHYLDKVKQRRDRARQQRGDAEIRQGALIAAQ